MIRNVARDRQKATELALALYEEAVERYERLADDGVINATQLSVVLAHYSDHLMTGNEWQGHRPALKLAGSLVSKAVGVAGQDNLKAQLMHAVFSLATATDSTAHRAALISARKIVEAANDEQKMQYVGR